MKNTGLGLFHSLGRLLYGKRVPPAEFVTSSASASAPAKKRRKNGAAEAKPEPIQLPRELLLPKETRPPLYFVPEEVLETAERDPANVVEWCFTNAPRFFGDISDLAEYTGALASSDVWDSSEDHFRGGAEAVPAPWDTLAARVQTRALLDANLSPIKPITDPWSSAGQGWDASQAVAFNMVRPIIRDMRWARHRRLEELRLCVEAVDRPGLRSIGSTTKLRTLPFVHLMLGQTRGCHPVGLPHDFMQLIKDMSTFDGGILTGRSDDGVSSSQSDRRNNTPGVQADWTLSGWNTSLDEDPIEGF
jgi:hypothetical protein